MRQLWIVAYTWGSGEEWFAAVFMSQEEADAFIKGLIATEPEDIEWQLHKHTNDGAFA